MTDCVITGVTLSPNPVNAGMQLLISVEITDRIYAILEKGGSMVLASDGAVVEYAG